MAGKKKLRNLPSKKNKIIKSIFPSVKGSQFQIGPYSIGEQFELFKSLEQPEATYIQCASAIIIICMLCQIRSLKLSSKPTQVDQLPCFRFYKRTFISGTPGTIFAMCLALSNPEVITVLPDDLDINAWCMSVIDCFQGNEKRPQSVNSGNVTMYVSGEMSRILELMNSCPSNNIALFGLDQCSIASYSIADCLAHIDYFPISSLEPALIINNIKREASNHFGQDGTSLVPLTFNEAPLTGEGSVEGGCKIGT